MTSWGSSEGVCFVVVVLIIFEPLLVGRGVWGGASVKLDFSTAYAPQHIHAVENTNICCGQHKKNVTHSISSPTGYAMSGFCPQHIPTIYVRSPQYICTHKLYLHSIHPQYKRRSPQHMAGMDTRTGYLMLSTIYV